MASTPCKPSESLLGQANYAVQFVDPHVETTYGKVSIVRAGLAGFALASEAMPKADWFLLLSGADYPVANQEKVSRRLGETSCNALIDQNH